MPTAFPRVSRAEQDALIHMCIYDAVRPPRGKVRTYEALAAKGYATSSDAGDSDPKKSPKIYRMTSEGREAIRLAHGRGKVKVVRRRRRARR